MALLLDTHALLWALTDPDALSPTARRLVADSDTDLVVSAASAWELATKHRLGRLPDAGPLLAAHHRHVARLGAGWLDITADHALLAGGMAWRHRDPFDRMLAAQCLVEGLTFVTKDLVFADVGGLRLAW
ncbi:MAG: type II toxin-antitoxin system VapC family toxin [Dermatophilaceae bacterium]